MRLAISVAPLDLVLEQGVEIGTSTPIVQQATLRA
jgi:hypothetical protein